MYQCYSKTSVVIVRKTNQIFCELKIPGLLTKTSLFVKGNIDGFLDLPLKQGETEQYILVGLFGPTK